jgi:hypothetical protein
MVRAGCQSILCGSCEAGISVDGTIMMKSLLTGIAICTTLAVFAGNANAYKAHAHKTHKTTTTGPHRGSLPNGTRVNTGPHGNDLLYESCDAPWKHPAYQCPGSDFGG